MWKFAQHFSRRGELAGRILHLHRTAGCQDTPKLAVNLGVASQPWRRQFVCRIADWQSADVRHERWTAKGQMTNDE